MMKVLLALIASCTVYCTLLAAPVLQLAEGPEVQAALDHISADSMRGNLSFLASDALEGRNTPSRGLDIAAEFIASQFRRAGLAAPINGSYFQYADFYQLTRRTDGLSVVLENGGQTVHAGLGEVTVGRSTSPIDLDSIPIYKLGGDSVPDDVGGKAVIVKGRAGASLMRSLREKNAAIVIVAGGTGARNTGRPASQLVAADQLDTATTPVITIRHEDAGKLLESLSPGLTSAKITLHSPGPQKDPVRLRNVIGLLRGSDPQLQNTYIVVSAHYDHLGINPTGTGDRIYNGANDDGSGTVSVIELADALASMHPRPKRSILFMTVFGEEEGLLGSQYYGRHPIFPLKDTIADVNIEQIGRTDDEEGPQVKSATFTGFQYSDLPSLFAMAGGKVGVKVYDRSTGSDSYFSRSDNQALADAGIPSHTVAVALEFPDYHKVGDEWDKIDYTNMTAIDRMLGLGIISLANDLQIPQWNESNPNTKKYLASWQKLHPALAY